MLSVKDLYVSYGQSEALHGINLQAEKKETEDGLKNTTSQREELRNQLEQLRQEFQNLKKEEKPKSDKLPRVAKLKSKKRSEEED